MNERIRELALQAERTFGGTFAFNGGEVSMVDLEKFAELIVKECVAIIQIEVGMKYKDGWEQHGVSDDWAAGHYNASLESRVLLKRHFGVEEQEKVALKPKCSVCGTTENVKYMGGYQPYLCESIDCIPF